MLSPTVYSIMHLLGVMMLFLGYGALIGGSLDGRPSAKTRKLAAITAGIGLLLMLIAAFGLIARVYGNQFQLWMWLKLAIWVAFGGLFAIIKRQPALALPLWWGVLVLGLLASILVYARPFVN